MVATPLRNTDALWVTGTGHIIARFELLQVDQKSKNVPIFQASKSPKITSKQISNENFHGKYVLVSTLELFIPVLGKRRALTNNFKAE